MNIFRSVFDSIRARKGFFILLIISSIIMIVLGVISAINFDGGVLVIDLNNITYIKFLKDDCGFAFLIFGSLINIIIFYIIIFSCCCKRYFIPLSIIFYLYFVYSQALIFTSILLIYGFFNTIILLILLLVYIFFNIFLFMILICLCVENSHCHNYFSTCFRRQDIMILSPALLLVSIAFCIILTILKSFVILLIY